MVAFRGCFAEAGDVKAHNREPVGREKYKMRAAPRRNMLHKLSARWPPMNALPSSHKKRSRRKKATRCVRSVSFKATARRLAADRENKKASDLGRLGREQGAASPKRKELADLTNTRRFNVLFAARIKSIESSDAMGQQNQQQKQQRSATSA